MNQAINNTQYVDQKSKLFDIFLYSPQNKIAQFNTFLFNKLLFRILFVDLNCNFNCILIKFSLVYLSCY